MSAITENNGIKRDKRLGATKGEENIWARNAEQEQDHNHEPANATHHGTPKDTAGSRDGSILGLFSNVTGRIEPD